MSRLLPMMVGLLLAPTTASAQWVCPDPADYTTDQPTLDTLDLEYDCDPTKGHLGANQCAESYYSEPLEPNGRLFVWLAATNSAPQSNRHVLNMASFAGYKVLAPAWSNQQSTFAHCTDWINDPDVLGGYCSSGCALATRQEIQYGRNVDGGEAHTVSRLEGVEHRVAMALEQLHALHPSDGWDDYCVPDPEHGTRVKWEQVVVGGHSVGANQAQFISYSVDTHGAFMVEGGYDFCEATLDTTRTLEDQITDPSADINFTGVEVNYYDDIDDASNDPVNRIFALHRDDVYPSADWPVVPPSFPWLLPGGINATTGIPNTGEVFDIDGTGTLGTERILATSQVSACGGGNFPEHGSMAGDGCMPKALAGGAVLDDPDDPGATAEAHVFEAYLDALCSLQ